MAIKEFEENDIFFNTMKTKPSVKFSIFNGRVYYSSNFSNTVSSGYSAIGDLNFNTETQSDCNNNLNFSEECNTQYIPLI